MKNTFLSVVLIAILSLISACGKDDAKPAPSNPGPIPSPNPNTQPSNNNGSGNCYCDECGCFILYGNGSYVDVDSCGT
ncbi:MAG: hypothetical protein FJ116_04605 [Deltaproteobacteria bacterium]|nr:hypothetical protein [Deltaproteobacteria bacterium]